MALSVDEEFILREWAPLTDLFQKLPTKTQNGIFQNDLKLTCIDVITDFIAIGTNSGVVYWFDRKRKDLQRLRCENSNSCVTVVKIISTVDYMLACGNNDGNISIFQIPKIHPDGLPESLRPKNKQVERYTVSDMHKGSISVLEWSKNGMKLFSGDINGLVILTEIDFYMHLCKSIEILNETYEVVQLSYHQQNLLVSTTYRSIVCEKNEKWKVSQVGKKDRKSLGYFGGLFYQNGLKPTDILLYCTRPGLRIWVADIEGSVQRTLLFKDLLNQEPPEISVLNPISTNLRRLKPNKEASFGKILQFNEDLLVTYNNDVLYVLNPKELSVLATISHLRGVLDVATNKDEIFILEGERSLIRVAFTPETINELSPTPISRAPNTFLPSTIREITNKMQMSTITSAIPPLIETVLKSDFVIQTDQTSVTNAEEACESPMHKPKPFNDTQAYSDRVYESHRKLELYNKIAEQEFDDTILFKHGRRKKSDMTASICSSASSDHSDEKESSITKATIMNMSMVGILPDLRSPDSIQNDIEQKEKMLADILNFDKIKIDLNKLLVNEDCNENKNNILINKKNDNRLKNEVITQAINGDIKTTLEVDSHLSYTKMVDSLKYNSLTENLQVKQEIQKDVKHVKNKIKEDSMKNKINEASPVIINNGKDDIKEASVSKINEITPACQHIPVSWKVFHVNLENKTEIPENGDLNISLNDWEII